MYWEYILCEELWQLMWDAAISDLWDGEEGKTSSAPVQKTLNIQ